MTRRPEIPALTWTELCLLFGIPTFLNMIACWFAIPFLAGNHHQPIEAAYFLSAGGPVMVPMFIGAIVMAGREIGSYRTKDILERFRIKRLGQTDLIWRLADLLGFARPHW